MSATAKERTAMRDAIATWKEMRKNYLSMQNTAMQLFSHPDATDEQILHVARMLGEKRKALVDSKHKIMTHRAYHDMWLGNDIGGLSV